eukprot:gene6189-6825_t
MGRKPFFPRGNHMTDQFPSNSEVYDKDERLEVGSGNDSEGIGVGSDGPSRVLQLERFVSPASTQRLYTHAGRCALVTSKIGYCILLRESLIELVVLKSSRFALSV